MKKLIKVFLSFTFTFIFIMTVKASSPATFEYSGNIQITQGDTVTYVLKVKSGDTFFTNGQDNWTYDLGFSSSVFKFVSFTSTINGITCIDHSTYCTLTIPSPLTGPYNVGDTIGTLTLNVLDNAVVGATTLKSPGTESTGSTPTEKSITVVSNSNTNVDTNTGTNDKSNSNDDIKLYIVIGCMTIVVITLLVAIVSITRNKKK